MLNASGMTRADLLASIESAFMIQVLDNHRIRCNRHLRGLNRCPSAYPLLLVISTLADVHAYIDCTRFEMHVHGCSMHQAWKLADLHTYSDCTKYIFPDVRAWMLNASAMTLADLHASITLKLQIQGTIPYYVVYHPVHISYSMCRYYSIHCPPSVYTLSKASRSVTALEPIGLGQANMELHSSHRWYRSHKNTCLRVIELEIFACNQM